MCKSNSKTGQDSVKKEELRIRLILVLEHVGVTQVQAYRSKNHHGYSTVHVFYHKSITTLFIHTRCSIIKLHVHIEKVQVEMIFM